MVLKRTIKTKKTQGHRASKKIKGGNLLKLLDDVKAELQKLQKLQKFKEYEGLIKIILGINEKCRDSTSEDECTMTDKEIQDKVTELAAKIVTNTNKATDKPINRTVAFVQRDISSTSTQQDINKTLFKTFNTQYKSILTKINNHINADQKSALHIDDNFKSLLTKLKALPNIKTSLTTLNTGNDLKTSYLNILSVLKDNCTGWKSTICSLAASIEPKVNTLYRKLYANIDEVNITDKILLDFIHDVIPIILEQLENIGIFKTELQELEKLNSTFLVRNGGSRNKSTHERREILGKLMKIYKIPNDKKEYVKHKGSLITVKQYKANMKLNTYTKKIIMGRERCVYKVLGSKKVHVKYKGSLVAVTDYIKLVKKSK